MKKFKYLASLLVAPLLIACAGSEINFDFEAPTIDVDSIGLGDLKRDTLTGEIKSDISNVYFDFFEVSDFHGAVNYSVEEKTIGLAKMADYFAKERLVNPGGTIILSSGDMYQGSAESNMTHGYIVNYSMNVMGFEAMTLGNHEFDWGLDWLRKESNVSVEDYKIPYLGANIYDKATGQILDFLKPSTIITRGVYKIGIIGTIGDGCESSIMKSLVSSLEFRPEFAIAKAEARRLRDEEGCNVVVWASHRDSAELSQLGLTKFDGIDVVFGGHTHDNSPADGVSTTVINGIPYLETKNFGKGIAHARVAVDMETKEVVSAVGDCNVEPYATEGLVEHSEVKRIVDTYKQHIDPIKNQVIGETDGELDVADAFRLTNLCVDTMQLAANKWGKDNGDIKVIASFHNAKGGVRSPIASGSITFGDVYKSFPFDNEIVVVKTNGKKLKNYFKKISNAGIWRDTSIINKLDDLVETEEYYFTTTDFMATSNSFAFKLKDADLIRTGYIVRDAIAGRIKSQKTIKASGFDHSVEQFKAPN